MSLNLEQKQAVVAEVAKEVAGAQAIVLVENRGLLRAVLAGIGYVGTDPVAVAKVLNDFAKGHEKFVITGGAMPGQVMSAKDVAALAALPSREELIAKLLGTMQAPVTKFVRTLNEVPARFVRTLAAVRDAKEAA